MSTSDLDQLIDMGFERERAEMAVKKTGGLQDAIDWLDKNQEKSLDQIKEEDATAEPAALNPGEEARSLVCDDCGKRFPAQHKLNFTPLKPNMRISLNRQKRSSRSRKKRKKLSLRS